MLETKKAGTTYVRFITINLYAVGAGFKPALPALTEKHKEDMINEKR